MLSNATREAIDEQEYPLTTDELIDAVGERALLRDGTETVGDALDRLGTETFERPEDARLALYTGISGDAVGRKGYSDRDPPTTGTPYGHEQISF